ncbi:MAG: MFS transporter [Firmicutes bacterium]|nr:MFS transporter [Bacillota bacterium]
MEEAIKFTLRVFSALKHRNFRLFWFGQLISLIGSWMQIVAQGWLVLKLTNSPFYLGLVGALAGLPVLIFSLFAGVIADRLNKRLILVFTQITMMLLAFVLSYLVGSGIVKVWHVIILASFMGVAAAFDTPTRQSFVVEMVGKEDLMNAIALNSSIFNGARVIGPAIAGILISKMGLEGCFLVNGISFIPVIIGLLMIRTSYDGKEKKSGTVWEDIREGLSYIKHDKTVSAMITLVATTSICIMPYAVLMPAFARDILHTDAHGFGILMSSVGLGALFGALSLAAMGNFKRKGLIVSAGNAVLPLAVIAFSFTRNFHLGIVFLMIIGWAIISQNATINTLLQSMVPDHLRGRVMSVYVLMFMGMMPIGSFIGGFAAQYLGVPHAILVGGIVFLFVAIITMVKVPQIQRL